jgi:Zn-dependent M28 family amino/carboxypeptidase
LTAKATGKGVGLSIVRSLIRIVSAVAACLLVIMLLLKLLVGQPVTGNIPTTLDARADAENLRKHVGFICGSIFPRNSDHPDVLDQAATYVADQLELTGGRVEKQRFRVGKPFYTNVIATYGPTEGPTLIVGAHYDVFGEHPGADDNASGVAGLLELGRLLGQKPPSCRVDLVAFALEEPPFFGSENMGSAHHARLLTENQREVIGMISLEMIGYYAERQQWGSWVLASLYPTRGDFVMVVGRWQDRKLARYVKKAMRGASEIRVRSSNTPRLAGMDASDHRSYWDSGFDAVMLTDTAYLRNPHYHTDRDVPDTLDYDSLALVVDGVFGVATNLDRLVQ